MEWVCLFLVIYFVVVLVVLFKPSFKNKKNDRPSLGDVGQKGGENNVPVLSE